MVCLLQMAFLIASVRQITCHTRLTLSTPEERPEGVKIGTLSTAFSPPYRLLGSSYLRVDEETGDVYTTEYLIDRETLCPSQEGGYCTISADALMGPEQELLKITVIVEDINDNAPDFETKEIRVTIPEDARVGTRVLLDDKAQDEDIGSNAEISYHLEGAEGFFSVLLQDNSDIELIVERELDRETRSEHCMVLVAVDRGSVPLSASVSFVVTVQDVDDQCPQFSPDNPRTVSVPGGATRGTILAQVQAVDPDLGSNSQITYSFNLQISDRAKELFHLDRNTGKINIAIDLRLDRPEEHVLKVILNSPSCPVEQTQLTVYLQPVLSPEPVIEIKYVARHRNQTILLRENEPPTLLALLDLKDFSSVQKTLSFELDSTAFSLKAQAGSYLLSTIKPLDFESCSTYLVSVVVSEAQGKHVHARKEIKVEVEDVNDNAPQFEEAYYQVEIGENNEAGISLIQVSASDADSRRYGKVSYRLIDSPAIFTIDEVKGVVYVMESLDREQQGEYSLTVLARDNGSPPLEAFSSVSIKVLDRNDNQPAFATPNFVFFISEDLPHLAQVGTIGILDADEGDNGKVVDVQVLDKDVPFSMDVAQSALRCTGEVDREKHEHYELRLLAIDGGSPQRSSTASVTIYVEDVNDNQPQVILPSSNLSCLTISPSARAGSIITKIYATDRDSGMNSDISYQIIAREPIDPSPFQIDPTSGSIMLLQQLVGKEYSMHHLLIRVSDGGKPAPLQATVWVNVLVNEMSKQCHLTTVPPYSPLASEPPLPPKPYNQVERCTDLPWLLLLCGLAMLIFSVCLFLATVIICVKQKRLTQKRTRVRDHTREHELEHLNE